MVELKDWFRQAVEHEYDMLFASILMLVIVVFMSFQVIARTIGISSVWVPEMSQMAHLFIVFILLARLHMDDEHIKIEFFFKKFPRRAQEVFDLVTDALIIFVALVVSYSSLLYMIEFSHVRTPGAGIPRPVLFFPAFIGFLLYAYLHMRDFTERSPRTRRVLSWIQARYR